MNEFQRPTLAQGRGYALGLGSVLGLALGASACSSEPAASTGADAPSEQGGTGSGGTDVDDSPGNSGGATSASGTGGNTTLVFDPNVGSASECGPFSGGPDLDVCTVTYLGGAGDQEANAVDISHEGAILVGGSFLAPVGVTKTSLGSGHIGMLRLSATGKSILSAFETSGRVADLEVDEKGGSVVLCGDFGIGVLGPELKEWNWNVSTPSERCAIGSDGTVAAIVGGNIELFDASGATLGPIPVPTGNATDVAVHGTSNTILFAGWSQDDNGSCSQLQIAAYFGFSYSGEQRFKGYGPTHQEAHAAGELCADTRSHRVIVGRNDQAYFLGHSAGGNSIFQRDPLNLALEVEHTTVDSYTVPFNTRSNHIAFFAQFDPTTGVRVRSQWNLARKDGDSGDGETLLPSSIAVDELGNVLVTGWNGVSGPHADQQKIAGIPIGQQHGPFALMVSPDFSTRLLWTVFSGAGGGMGFGTALGSGVTALIGRQDEGDQEAGPIITVDALQSAPIATGDEPFLAVWPAPSP